MTTQAEIRLEADYEWIDSLARELVINRWRKPDYAMQAVGAILRQAMDSRDCVEWTITAWTDIPNTYSHEVRIDKSDSTGVVIDNGYGREWRFSASRFTNPHGDDATYSMTDVAFSIMWPDLYTTCNVCRSLILHDAHDDGRGCDACGAEQMVCELDCCEFGGLVCMHHGREMIPLSVFMEHDQDWAAAEAAVAAAV